MRKYVLIAAIIITVLLASCFGGLGLFSIISELGSNRPVPPGVLVICCLPGLIFGGLALILILYLRGHIPQRTSEAKKDTNQASPTPNVCPICKKAELIASSEEKLMGLVKTQMLKCLNCTSRFIRDKNKYRLSKVKDTANPIWLEYQNQALSENEWKNIANGGMSDAKQKEVDLNIWLDKLSKGTVTIGANTKSPVYITKNENIIFAIPDTKLMELRSVRGRHGSYENLTELDSGVLTITNQRIIFSGLKRSITTDLNEILSIDPYQDGFAISKSNKTKKEYYIGTNETFVSISISDRVYQQPLNGDILVNFIRRLRAWSSK